MLQYVSAPEATGVSSLAVMRLLDEISAHKIDVHSIMIARHGKIAARLEWAPYDACTASTLFSLSKSFTSCATGFAAAEGLLSFDDKICELLPDKVPADASNALRKITIGDLLCMGSGMSEESDVIPADCIDWEKYFLSCPVKYPPRTHFHYNTISTYVIACALQRVTGMTVRDYLQPRLFDKLGIQTPQWDCSPTGVNCAGFGLHLSCEDILKFGQLLLDHGMWNSERVLPKGWVELASRKHMDNGTDPNNDWNQGYGYLFWRTRGGRYRGDGAYGQICMVDEANDTVVAAIAGVDNMGDELDAVNTFFKSLSLPMGDTAAQKQLAARTASLHYDFPRDDGSGFSINASYIGTEGRFLRIENNPDGSICLHRHVPGSYPAFPMLFGLRKPIVGEFISFVPGEQPQKALCAYGWQKGSLHFVMRTPAAPYMLDACLTFSGKCLTVEMTGTVTDCGIQKYTRI